MDLAQRTVSWEMALSQGQAANFLVRDKVSEQPEGRAAIACQTVHNRARRATKQ